MGSCLSQYSSGYNVFFSSRRRHTIFDCDWSSDVCSSDLTADRVDALVDATHPYAAIISANAAAAAAATRVPLLALRRPPWAPLPGDRWIEVADTAAAVEALGEAPRRVFVTLGKTEIGTFARAPQHHYLVRSVEPV